MLELYFDEQVRFFERHDALEFLFSLPSIDWQEDFIKKFEFVDFEFIWKNRFLYILDNCRKFRNKTAIKTLFEKWVNLLSDHVGKESDADKRLPSTFPNYSPDEALEDVRYTIAKQLDD